MPSSVNMIQKYSSNKSNVHLFFLYSQWDILSNGGLVQEMAHIANGRDPGNSVSLLRVNVSYSCTINRSNNAMLPKFL